MAYKIYQEAFSDERWYCSDACAQEDMDYEGEKLEEYPVDIAMWCEECGEPVGYLRYNSEQNTHDYVSPAEQIEV